MQMLLTTNNILTETNWDQLISRKQLPACCDHMENLYSSIRSLKYYEGTVVTYGTILSRYHTVTQLHDMSMFPVLTLLIDIVRARKLEMEQQEVVDYWEQYYQGEFPF